MQWTLWTTKKDARKNGRHMQRTQADGRQEQDAVPDGEAARTTRNFCAKATKGFPLKVLALAGEAARPTAQQRKQFFLFWPLALG